jgi:CheY-like chemotaxis protein
MVLERILFADDNVHIREFVQQTFAREGYCVVLARDGDEAVRLAVKERFDLIILDLGMPSVGGVEAARRIKTVCPSIPIVFFTAHDKERLPANHGEFAVACVEKTEDLTKLKQVVATLLANRVEKVTLRTLMAGASSAATD